MILLNLNNVCRFDFMMYSGSIGIPHRVLTYRSLYYHAVINQQVMLFKEAQKPQSLHVTSRLLTSDTILQMWRESSILNTPHINHIVHVRHQLMININIYASCKQNYVISFCITYSVRIFSISSMLEITFSPKCSSFLLSPVGAFCTIKFLILVVRHVYCLWVQSWFLSMEMKHMVAAIW